MAYPAASQAFLLSDGSVGLVVRPPAASAELARIPGALRVREDHWRIPAVFLAYAETVLPGARLKITEDPKAIPDAFSLWNGSDSTRITEEAIKPEKTEDSPPVPGLAYRDRGVLVEALRARKYSPRTVKAYCRYVDDFLKFTKLRPREGTDADLTAYLAFLERSRGASAATLNLAISAIRFFYAAVLGLPMAARRRRPKQDKRLPLVLSKDEVLPHRGFHGESQAQGHAPVGLLRRVKSQRDRQPETGGPGPQPSHHLRAKG